MTEKTTKDNWLHYSESQPKRKRAELVCIACHSKKIKCDLQLRKEDGKEDCSHCASSRRDCQIRPSRREKRRKANRETTHDRSVPGDEEISSGVNLLLATDTTFQAPTEANLQTGPSAIATSPHQNRNSPGSLQNIHTRDSWPMPSPQHTFQNASSHITSPAVQRRPTNTSQTETVPKQDNNINSEFLQTFAPENQFDAVNQALVVQLEHRYSSELCPDLEQIFTETYYTYSYPWCPVLDRNTLSSDVARSPLLANALALASSHIQPPLLPHDGPEAYYKRARTIFYDDEEADEMMALRALCLFYWWAPQSLSRVHRHSLWYVLQYFG